MDKITIIAWIGATLLLVWLLVGVFFIGQLWVFFIATFFLTLKEVLACSGGRVEGMTLIIFLVAFNPLLFIGMILVWRVKKGGERSFGSLFWNRILVLFLISIVIVIVCMVVTMLAK